MRKAIKTYKCRDKGYMPVSSGSIYSPLPICVFEKQNFTILNLGDK